MTMYQPVDLSITSKNSLINTIKTDRQVRRWFLYLILQRDLEEELSENKGTAALYKQFKAILYPEKAVFLLLLGIILFIVVTQRFQYGSLFAVFFVISVFLQLKKRACLVRICANLVKRDFERALFAQKTLYQIGEFYSRKYNIPSLVNTITSVDIVTRKAVFYTIIFATFIYPLNFWQICAAVLAAYYIFYGLASLTYKQVK